MSEEVIVKKKRGFATMDPQKVKEIASKGGVAAHKAGTAHEFTSEEAKKAGRKGGQATHIKRVERELNVKNKGGIKNGEEGGLAGTINQQTGSFKVSSG